MRLEQRGDDLGYRRLAVGADDVDRLEAVLGHAEHRHELLDPLEPEAHAERLARCQERLGLIRGPHGRWPRLAELGELGPVALELGALGLDDLGRAPWRRSPRWRACAPQRSTSASSCARRSARRSSACVCVDLGGGEHLDRADRGQWLAALGLEVEPREARDELVAARRHRSPAPPTRSSGDTAELAPAPDLSDRVDRGGQLGLCRGVEASAGRPRGTRRSSGAPSTPGRYAQISSVTNGITGCSEREHPARARAGGCPPPPARPPTGAA